MRHSLQALVGSLYDGGVVKIDPEKGFRLKLHDTQPNAPLSPYYINLRTPDNKGGPLTQDLVDKIGRAMWQYAKPQLLESLMHFRAAAGLPKAGDPLAEAFVKAAAEDGSGIPLLRLHKTVGEHSREIDAIVDTAGVAADKTVLLIDDLVTEGHTKDEAIGVMRKAGYRIANILVVLDREQGGREHLMGQGITLDALLTVPQMLECLVEQGRISAKHQNVVLDYIKNQKK